MSAAILPKGSLVGALVVSESEPAPLPLPLVAEPEPLDEPEPLVGALVVVKNSKRLYPLCDV